MAKPVIVLVGHCGPDAWALKSAVSRAVAGASVVFANDAEALAKHLPGADLLLVNRVLDGEFDVQSGIDLIRALSQSPGSPRCMLISNFAEAQAGAQEAGALPGFGKTEMNSDLAAERLRVAVARDP